jgi:hypothetical protein
MSVLYTASLTCIIKYVYIYIIHIYHTSTVHICFSMYQHLALGPFFAGGTQLGRGELPLDFCPGTWRSGLGIMEIIPRGVGRDRKKLVALIQVSELL